MRSVVHVSAFALLGAYWLAPASAACASNFAAMTTVASSLGGYVRSLAFIKASENDVNSKDLLVAGGEDQKLRVYELSGSSPSVTATLTNTLGSIHGTIWSLKWINTDKILVSASGDGAIRLWPLSVLVATQTCAGNEANCCDGDGLGCEGIYKFSWRDAAMTRERQVHSVEYIATGSLIATGWGDGKIRIWDYSTSNPRLAFKRELEATGRAYQLAYLSTPAVLAMASPDWPSPELWETTGSLASKTLTTALGDVAANCGHLDGVGALATNSAGSSVATGSIDGTIKIWIAATGALHFTLDGHGTKHVTALAWMDAETKLVSGDSVGDLKFWDPTTSGTTTPAHSVSSAHSNQISALAWLDSLELVASASYDLSIKLFECA